MRAVLLTLALGVAGAALWPSHQAAAWYDRWGRWHPGHWGPPAVVVAPPPVVYAPVVPRRYAHWVRPHYDYYGRFIPGHWV